MKAEAEAGFESEYPFRLADPCHYGGPDWAAPQINLGGSWLGRAV